MGRKFNFKKKKPSVKSNAKKISKLMHAPETKYHYSGSAIANRTGGSHYFSLNNIVQGTAIGERIANKVKNLSINVRILFGLPVQEQIGTETSMIWSLTYFTARVRIVLLCDIVK